MSTDKHPIKHRGLAFILYVGIGENSALLSSLIRDKYFCRRVASKFLLLSGSYCLTMLLPRLRRQPDDRRDQRSDED